MDQLNIDKANTVGGNQDYSGDDKEEPDMFDKQADEDKTDDKDLEKYVEKVENELNELEEEKDKENSGTVTIATDPDQTVREENLDEIKEAPEEEGEEVE